MGMATNYKLKVQVEIVKCADDVTDAPGKEGVGIFEHVIPAAQAHSIDECEQSLLQTNYAALRDALAHHLSAVSRQHVLETGGSLAECEVKPYRVEGEVGRVTFDSYWIGQADGMDDHTARSPFPTLHAKEWYRTTGFKELALVHGTVEESYRKTSALINRVRHQEEATPSRTLRENTEDEGRQVMAYLEQQVTTILHEQGFTTAGTPTETATDCTRQPLVTLPPEQVERAMQASAPESEWVAEMKSNPVPYEDPAQSTSVSLDDVGVKRQKAIRKERPEPGQEHKYVHNTIAHIAHAGRSYIINGHGVVNVLRLVLAFLLHNQLLTYNLLFFVDGQRTLYTAILCAFVWLSSIQIILDWYHLERRCKEQLSMALKGYVIRNALLEQLLPCLWNGCVDRAMALLQSVEPTQIKNQEALADLIGYLERNRPYIPCYSVRKRLGLRNSSNVGEKSNDLVVSERQKHNGMSWSKPGSGALAAITALVRNREYKQWFQTCTLSFSFSASC
jgi:hypothetical protein